MAELPGANDFEKLAALTQRTYKEQVVWFLNAFWEEFAQNEAEKLWKYKHMCDELDVQKGASGFELDELSAHRFLEHFKEPLTVREMRNTLRSTGAIGDRVKAVPLIHVLIFKYKIDWHTLVNASQGDNREEIEEAQRRLDEVQAAFSEARARADEAAARFREAEASEAAAKKREAEALESEKQATQREAEALRSEEEAKAREEDARAAQAELEAALGEVKAQEDAYNNKTADLTRRSEEGGVVSRNKAKAELAQHLAEDPLPLRRAKITAEAAVKKAEKATAVASQARQQAEEDAVKARQAREQAQQDAIASVAARKQAEADKVVAAQAKEAAEHALNEAQRKVQEAEEFLTEVKSRPGCAHGALWWIERELHEAKAYVPESKGGYRKK